MRQTVLHLQQAMKGVRDAIANILDHYTLSRFAHNQTGGRIRCVPSAAQLAYLTLSDRVQGLFTSGRTSANRRDARSDLAAYSVPKGSL